MLYQNLKILIKIKLIYVMTIKTKFVMNNLIQNTFIKCLSCLKKF